MNDNMNRADNNVSSEMKTMDFLLQTQTSVNNSQSRSFGQNTNNNLSPKSSNKKVLPIILIILFILIAITIGVLFYLNKDSNKSNNVPTTENNESNIVWNGVYQNGDNVIYVYQLDSKNTDFDVRTDNSYIQGTAKVKGNKAELEIFNVYTFELSDNKIKFSSNDENVESAVYTKVSDYSKEDYYKNHYGDPKYLQSDINGVFENDDVTIKIWQSDEETVGMHVVSEKQYFSITKYLDIIDNEFVYDETSFGDEEKINASIDGDRLIITASSTDGDDSFNKISGTYVKTKNYTIDEIINDNN